MDNNLKRTLLYVTLRKSLLTLFFYEYLGFGIKYGPIKKRR